MIAWAKRFLLRSRADTRSAKVGQRRLRSGRGAAFLEFALLAPFLLMICSLMIETAVFWDASVMANHAAWTVGRIMKVKDADETRLFQIGEFAQPKKDEDGKEKKVNPYKVIAFSGLNTVIKGVNTLGDQRNLATIMLMSSCSMGYVGKPGNEFADLFRTIVTEPINKIAEEIPKSIEKMITGKSPSTDSDKSSSSSFTGKIRKAIAKWAIDTIVQPIIDTVMKKLVGRVTKWVEGKLGGLGQKLDKALTQGGEFSPMKHTARNFQKAIHRIASLADGTKGQLVLTQTANDGDIGSFTFLQPRGTQTYPQINASAPGYKDQIVLVRVQWPMESDWLFPLFWGGVRENSGVWASGHSLVLREPTLKNDDLLSDGKSTYTPPEENTSAIGKVSDQICKDSRIELFLMRYRNTREELTVHEDGGFWDVLTTKWVQPWRDIAYEGKGVDDVPAAYKKSWEHCLNLKWDSTHRWDIRSAVSKSLKGYPTREWLWYETTSIQRFRYTGTAGREPYTGIVLLHIVTDPSHASTVHALTKQILYSPTKMLEALRELGYGQTLPDDPDTAIQKAQNEARETLSHFNILRRQVDKNIAELTKRIEGDGASGMELDPDSLSSLTGEDLTEGDTEITSKNLEKKWEQMLAELKACRDRLNPIVKDVADSRALLVDEGEKLRNTLFGAYLTYASAFYTTDRTRFDLFDSKRDAELRAQRKADVANALVEVYQSMIWPQIQKLNDTSSKLETHLQAAYKEEVRIGQIFGLNATSKLDPDKINWAGIAAGLAEDDGVKPTDDPTNDGKSYGDMDGRGEGPWKR